MQKNRHRVLRSGKTLMAMAALVLFLAAVSHAVSFDQLTKQPLDKKNGLVVDAGKKEKDKDKKNPVSVPEPSASLLLLMGLGAAGLADAAMERRKRRA